MKKKDNVTSKITIKKFTVAKLKSPEKKLIFGGKKLHPGGVPIPTSGTINTTIDDTKDDGSNGQIITQDGND